YTAAGKTLKAQLGGAARLGATLTRLRQGHPETITVAAGDLIGASPLASAYFLDEPTIMALNRLGLSISSVGNHEFDHGIAELKRMQSGGCEVHTQRMPCRLDKPFEGAKFTYLAANVLDDRGNTLFPGTAIRRFGPVRIGFIGMTLKGTGEITSPAATKGYHFADEAETANRLAAQLKRQGADAVVVLLHQGGTTEPWFNTDSCPGLQGDILPILARLTPDIRLVVSGHTHKAYICEMPDGSGGNRLLTSAGQYGYFVTDIRLRVDPSTHRIASLSAVNDPVTADAGEQADVAQLISRYDAASTAIASRVVGHVTGSLDGKGAIDSPLARLVADAQLAATRDPAHGGAQIGFINAGGVRSGFTRGADGSVNYGQLFALQPFGNTLEVLQMSGAQLREALEGEVAGDVRQGLKTSYLIPSRGFSYTYDPAAPVGQRIVAMTLDGRPIDPAATYRVTVNNFLANGGDGFKTLAQAKFVADGGTDLDALAAFIANGVALDPEARIHQAGPAAPAQPSE
ncbi:MAG: bifunctional metallophosphatase/5'-nucleotidase, partial [Porphyrobacter sp.]|nr:bifunctional metallophosphatase/5'-nucleotidase [Porphyrobacter sp.]